MNNTIAIVLAYLVTILLILGGIACLYVSLRMINKRAKASGSATNFTADIAGHKFSIGTGSLAALVLSISVLWALLALLSKPRIEFVIQSGAMPQGALRLISSATIKRNSDEVENAEAEKILATVTNRQKSTASSADMAAQAAASAANDAAAAADAAAHAYDAAGADEDAAAANEGKPHDGGCK